MRKKETYLKKEKNRKKNLFDQNVNKAQETWTAVGSKNWAKQVLLQESFLLTPNSGSQLDFLAMLLI